MTRAADKAVVAAKEQRKEDEAEAEREKANEERKGHFVLRPHARDRDDEDYHTSKAETGEKKEEAKFKQPPPPEFEGVDEWAGKACMHINLTGEDTLNHTLRCNCSF